MKEGFKQEIFNKKEDDRQKKEDDYESYENFLKVFTGGEGGESKKENIKDTTKLEDEQEFLEKVFGEDAQKQREEFKKQWEELIKLPDSDILELEEKEIEEVEKPEELQENQPKIKLQKELNQEQTTTPEVKKQKLLKKFLKFGFYLQEKKSQAMAWICESALESLIKKEKSKKSPKGATEEVFKEEEQDNESTKGDSIYEQSASKRWLAGLAKTYRDEMVLARQKLVEIDNKASLKLSLQSGGYALGNVLKFGRTAADIFGWLAISPLRYAMMGAQFVTRTFSAAKEARLMNAEVIAKTRGKDFGDLSKKLSGEKKFEDQEEEEFNAIYDEAMRIYEAAQRGSKEKYPTKEEIERAYLAYLPEDLKERLNRLKKSPEKISGIVQWILRKDLENALKKGKADENLLKFYDAVVSYYGEIDVLASLLKYAETAGKATIAGVAVETLVAGGLMAAQERLGEKAIKPLVELLSPKEAYTAEVPDIQQGVLGEEIRISIPKEGSGSNLNDVFGGFEPHQDSLPHWVEVVPKKNDSIWTVAQKYLEQDKNFQAFNQHDPQAAQALRTYNIDRVKDWLLSYPEKYGLLKEPTKLSIEDLKNIKWRELLNDAIYQKGGLTTNLSNEQIESIIEHNKTLKDFFAQHPLAPRTDENYRLILEGKGDTGEKLIEKIQKDQDLKQIVEAAKEASSSGNAATVDLNRQPPISWLSPPEEAVNLAEQAQETVIAKEQACYIEGFVRKLMGAELATDKTTWYNENFLKNTKVADVLAKTFVNPNEEIDPNLVQRSGFLEQFEENEKRIFQWKIQKLIKLVGELKDRDPERVFQNITQADIYKMNLFEFLRKGAGVVVRVLKPDRVDIYNQIFQNQ